MSLIKIERIEKRTRRTVLHGRLAVEPRSRLRPRLAAASKAAAGSAPLGEDERRHHRVS